MKFLFLDVDGVLNSEKWYRSIRKVESELSHFDPAAVEILNRILYVNRDLEVVISSAWRKSHSHVDIAYLLLDKGLRIEHIDRFIGSTPECGYDLCDKMGLESRYAGRGLEIATWLDSIEVPEYSFVIIDDSSDMWVLKDQLVRTNCRKGLLEEHINEVNRALERKFTNKRWL